MMSELKSSDSLESLAPDDGMLKRVLTASTEKQAGKGTHVSMRYSMRIVSKLGIFDSCDSRRNGHFGFTVGSRKVNPCMERIAESMRLGEESEVPVEPQYAFSDEGLELFGVPPNVGIVYSGENDTLGKY